MNKHITRLREVHCSPTRCFLVIVLLQIFITTLFCLAYFGGLPTSWAKGSTPGLSDELGFVPDMAAWIKSTRSDMRLGIWSCSHVNNLCIRSGTHLEEPEGASGESSIADFVQGFTPGGATVKPAGDPFCDEKDVIHYSSFAATLGMTICATLLFIAILGMWVLLVAIVIKRHDTGKPFLMIHRLTKIFNLVSLLLALVVFSVGVGVLYVPLTDFHNPNFLRQTCEEIRFGPAFFEWLFMWIFMLPQFVLLFSLCPVAKASPAPTA